MSKMLSEKEKEFYCQFCFEEVQGLPGFLPNI